MSTLWSEVGGALVLFLAMLVCFMCSRLRCVVGVAPKEEPEPDDALSPADAAVAEGDDASMMAERKPRGQPVSAPVPVPLAAPTHAQRPAPNIFLGTVFEHRGQRGCSLLGLVHLAIEPRAPKKLQDKRKASAAKGAELL